MERIPWDASQLRRVREHPCFDARALHLFGRVHLPVAPRCNLQCNYCVRRFDCVNESRPGVTSRVLSPRQALRRLEEVVKRHPWIKVVAVAGPGEPLFNEETFETFRLVRKRFPRLHRCLSTNGLLLPDRMEELEEVGIGTLTVTINAVDPKVGEKIYSSVLYRGRTYRGREGAELLIRNQLRGTEEAVRRGMVVKVNTVIIPTVNDRHVVEVAKRVGRMGVYRQNLIPLIPQFRFSHLSPPSPEEKARLQRLCSRYVPQMVHCRQCRADAVGKLGKDLKCYMK